VGICLLSSWPELRQVCLISRENKTDAMDRPHGFGAKSDDAFARRLSQVCSPNGREELTCPMELGNNIREAKFAIDVGKSEQLEGEFCSGKFGVSNDSIASEAASCSPGERTVNQMQPSAQFRSGQVSLCCGLLGGVAHAAWRAFVASSACKGGSGEQRRGAPLCANLEARTFRAVRSAARGYSNCDCARGTLFELIILMLLVAPPTKSEPTQIGPPALPFSDRVELDESGGVGLAAGLFVWDEASFDPDIDADTQASNGSTCAKRRAIGEFGRVETFGGKWWQIGRQFGAASSRRQEEAEQSGAGGRLVSSGELRFSFLGIGAHSFSGFKGQEAARFASAGSARGRGGRNGRAAVDQAAAFGQHLRQPLAPTWTDLGKTRGWPGGADSGKRSASLDGAEDEMIELLAQFYAHTLESENKVKQYLRLLKLQDQRERQGAAARGKSSKGEEVKLAAEVEREVRMKFGADEESLLKWLRQRQDKFSSLKNATFELLNEHPNRTINVCLDGPKILVLPNVSDILYCYTHDQWIDKLWSDLRLSTFHYPIIVLNILIFLFGTTGNIFVCLSVYRNHQLRNVTNYFIVNLAFADFLVILICLPATVVWDLSLTWFFGTIPCKLIMFLQVSGGRAAPSLGRSRHKGPL